MQLARFYDGIWSFIVLGFYSVFALICAAVITWGAAKMIGSLPIWGRVLWRLAVLIWALPWIYKVIAPFALFYAFSLLWIESMKGGPRSEDPPVRGRHVLSGQDARRRAAALVDVTSRNARRRS